MPRALRVFLLYQLPALLWTTVILILSGARFSSHHSGMWLQHLIASVLGHPLSEERFYVVHVAVRKLAHVVEYGLLSILMFRAVRRDSAVRWTLRWALLAMALATAVAGIDEWH